MRAFRRFYGFACFAYAAIALLWLFNVISLDASILVAGFLVMTAISFVIDAVVARQEKKATEGGANN